jgi:hypothetical protein
MKTVLSGPIIEFEESVHESNDGFQYYIAYTDDVIDGDIIRCGGKIAIKATTVDKYGMDALVGKQLERRERND